LDLRSVSNPLSGAGFLNRSLLSLVLVVVISVSSVYYARQAERESERSRLLAEMAEYELLLQTEIQHLTDLLYRSYDRSVSPDTPAIANSFPWVRGIGIVDTASSETQPTRHHLLTLSLAEVSRSLGGQITFAIVNDNNLLLVLSRADQPHTTRAIFSARRLLEFINDRVRTEDLGISVNVALLDGQEISGTDNPPPVILHLGLPGLEFEATVWDNEQNRRQANRVTSVVWLMVGSLWLVWLLLFFERRRRLRQQGLVAEQKQRIETQAGRSVLAEIASSIGHEINQPVAAIETLSDTATLMLKTGDHRKAAQMLQRIQSEALRVGQIIQTVRRLSSDQGLEFRPIDLVTTVRGLAPLAKIICKDVDLSFSTGATTNSLIVSADQTAIEQVVINLVVNSCEALTGNQKDPDRKPSVVISLTSHKGHAVVRVSDNGRGVADSIRDEIFSSFVTTKIDGLGLGLNLSRSIAEKHQGWLSLAETGVQGTTFELHLPLVK
jgi:signal transduction histidine kinase